MRKVTQGPIGDRLLRKLESKGITGLAFWDNGFKQMSANRPLNKVDDFRGLKMRIQSSKALNAEMRALGAIPQVMGFSEMYHALQTGEVDGAENTASNFYSQRLQEVQKHMTLSNHGYLGYAVIVNKRFWDELPPDIRATLEGAMKDATQYANEIAKKENEGALAAVKMSGKTEVETLSPEEKAAWKQALLPVHRQMEKRIGKELIRSIYKETGFQP